MAEQDYTFEEEEEGGLMKKITLFLSIMIAITSMFACGSSDMPENIRETTEKTGESVVEESEAATEKSESDQGDDVQTENGGQGKILIAYFSWADNALPDDIDAMTSASVTVPGNVAQLAAWIGEETGGELFPIQVEESYPCDWDSCLERANKEKTEGIHPALKTSVENLGDYDTVYLGFPNWWYSCPMAIFSFLDENDLSGKQIYLFCSHGTGGLAGSVRDISAALPDADISDNVFDVDQEDAASAKDEILEWLESVQ